MNEPIMAVVSRVENLYKITKAEALSEIRSAVLVALDHVRQKYYQASLAGRDVTELFKDLETLNKEIVPTPPPLPPGSTPNNVSAFNIPWKRNKSA